MDEGLVLLGTVAGWLGFIVLVVGGIAVAVSWVVDKRVERQQRRLW